MLEEFPEAVEEMDSKGLKYSFTALSKNDTASMRGRGWEDAFGTSDRAEAEKRYLVAATYVLSNARLLHYNLFMQIIKYCPMILEPRLKILFHRCKALGMDLEWQPDGSVKTVLGPRALTKVFDGRKGRRMWFNTVVGMHGKEISSACMADGTEIPENVVKRCEEIIEDESIQFKWEKGDVLFLDNLAVLHGRRPSMPPRKVLVATCK